MPILRSDRRPRRDATRVDALRSLVLAASIAGALALAPAARASVCEPYGADEAKIDDARRAVASACDCRSAVSAQAWRRCVLATVDDLRHASTLSPPCAAHVLRVETASTCGRSDRQVCCLFTETHASATIRPAGRCKTARSANACESPLAHVADACGSYRCDAATLLVDPERCGNGRIDEGEECDSADGRLCSASCRSCQEAIGQITLGCTEAATSVVAAAAPDAFLVGFDASTKGGSRPVVTRLDTQGNQIGGPVDVAAEASSRPPNATRPIDSVTVDDSGPFYVAWRGDSPGWRGRKVPARGAITSASDPISSSGGPRPFVGSCSYGPLAPLQIAPTLDDSGVHFTQLFDNGGSCGGADILIGVPYTFQNPSEGTGSAAPLARGAHDVAAVWLLVSFADGTTSPLYTVTLYGGWIEPDPGAFPIVPVADAGYGSPGLAAVGDTFLVAYLTSTGVRAVRFSRSGGVLDANGGITIASGLDGVDYVVVRSDGTRFVVAWRELRASGPVVRMARVAADGGLIDARPIDAVALAPGAAFDVAANPSAILVAFTSSSNGRPAAVRAVLLPNEPRG